MYLNGACYYVEKRKLSYSDAIANCQNTLRNGKLFEPRDKYTHDSVVAAAQKISSQMYWLGISDALSEGQFQYLSGGDLTFSNWRSGTHKKLYSLDRYNFFSNLYYKCVKIIKHNS